MSRYNKFIFLVIVLCLNSLRGYAQKNSTSFDQMKIDYPTDNEVIVEKSEKYTFSLKDGKLVVFKDSYFESLILGEQAINNSSKMYYETEFMPLVKYEAYTITPKNKKIKFESIKDSRENGSVFYDDLKQYKVVYYGLEVGSKKILKTRHEIKDAHFLMPFSFNSYMPAKKLSITIEVAKGIDISHLIYNESMDIETSIEDKRKKNIFRWERSNAKRLKVDDRSPGYLHTTPHLIFFVNSYLYKGKKTAMLGNTDLLFNYYSHFVEDLNTKEDSILKKITLDLVKDINKEEEKVKAIVYWVKDHIKYIAYEDGYGGFIPREASLVNSRKFGDCKDMTSIITSMASYANIDSVCIVWIGSRRLPYSYKEVPTPLVDDHMIAAYIKNGEIIFLDATDRFSSFGLASSFIQGKEAMIRTGDNVYKLYRVPIVPPEKNKRIDSLYIHIDSLKLIGHGKMIADGLRKTNYISRMPNDNTSKKFKYLKAIVQLGSNKFIANTIEDENNFNRELPMVLTYDFELDSYITVLSDEIYLNPFLINHEDFTKTLPDRLDPLKFDIAQSNIYHLELSIPNGYTVDLSKNKGKINNAFFDFEFEYTVEDDIIKLDYTLVRKSINIEKVDFEKWNSNITELNTIMKNSIQITK